MSLASTSNDYFYNFLFLISIIYSFYEIIFNARIRDLNSKNCVVVAIHSILFKLIVARHEFQFNSSLFNNVWLKVNERKKFSRVGKRF